MNLLARSPSFVLLLACCSSVFVAACSASRANCVADCDARVERCPADNLNCTALCDTYVDLGDSGGCGDERLIYQNCVVDAACSTDCTPEYNALNNCVGDNSPATCLRYCRDREDAGCADANCANTCILTEYLGRATACEVEVDRWTACLDDGSTCDAAGRCLSLLLDANNCRTAYCSAHPDEPSCP